MRQKLQEQMTFGSVDIAEIQFDYRCRDEIPKLLIGLQHIYINFELRQKVFRILEEIIPENVDQKDGRPGMDLWRILVLGTLKLNCNWNYDKLHDIANNHKTIRLMLGLGELKDEMIFSLSTLKDNVSLLTPTALNKINEEVIKYSHTLVIKKNEKNLRGQCDSFVVKTNVHYPTDINLLYDAMRKIILLTGRLCAERLMPGWRQAEHIIRKIKRNLWRIQKLKRTGGCDEEKKERKLKRAHKEYIAEANHYLGRAQEDIGRLECQITSKKELKILLLLKEYVQDAQRQIQQIDQRVLNGQKIPHEEKVFSIFERHTEWICKGKAGILQELGVKVCIVRDQFGFILNHEVMEKKQDVDIAVPIIQATKNKFPALNSCGFDKGFWNKDNKKQLEKILKIVVLPRKGRPTKLETEIDVAEGYRQVKREHGIVESSISALDNHGLDLCRDKKRSGFRSYVSLAVLARNIQIMGHIIQQRKLKKIQRNKEFNQAVLAAA